MTQFADIRMPGWLPTAVVVNIMIPSDARRGATVQANELITVTDGPGGNLTVNLPDGSDNPGWRLQGIAPLEVIDGQHRLWAFADDFQQDFQLPVVAFQGLDIGWQAYLFWTINVKPKRISPSLAFDLYPLLRTQSWLEPGSREGPLVYRETRSQELTEALWSHPASPWFQRINMLGEPGKREVSQAAFIRSLLASFVKRGEGRRVAIGGLFGSRLQGEPVLPWSRTQQAALLIFLWAEIRNPIVSASASWASMLDSATGDRAERFEGRFSLLATDQGVRAVFQVANDILFMEAGRLKLQSWRAGDPGEELSHSAISRELEALPAQLPECADLIRKLGRELAGFDWRTSSAPNLDIDERQAQAAYRGSGGYSLLRRRLLRQLALSADPELPAMAESIADRLGYELF